MIDIATVPVPQRMLKRPVYMGMRVPYTTWINPETGIPDFKIQDERHRVLCITRRWCSMCGEKMGKKIAFIGGPGSIEQSQCFLDAGSHIACARYAWSVCPYILYGKGHATHRMEVPPPGTALMEFRDIPLEPVERMGMLITETYEIVNYRGSPIVRAGKAESIEWKTYP